MAATLTLVSASPNALKYLFVADGSGAAQAAHKSHAELLADAQTATSGPSALAALLAQTFLDDDWVVLPKGALVSLYLTNQIAQVAGLGMAAAFTSLIGPEQRMTISGVGITAGDTVVVELRFNHSLER